MIATRFEPPPRFQAPQRRYAGYIFDCDGTLADTMPLHYRAWQAALVTAGAPFEFTWDLFTSRAGMTLEQTVSELSLQFTFALDPVTTAQNQRRAYAALETDVQPVPGVLEFAREVSTFAPVSVASGSYRPGVLRSLSLIGAGDLFSIVVTPESVQRGKPHPDMFLLAAELMGVAPHECLVLEDGEFGFEAARRAGMDFVVVRG